MSKVLNDLAKKHPDKIDSIERDDTGWIINLTDDWVETTDPLEPSHMIFEDTVAECVAAFRSIKPAGKKTASNVTYQRVCDGNERQMEGKKGRIYESQVGWVYEVRVDGEYVDNFEKLRHVKKAYPNAVRRPVE